MLSARGKLLLFADADGATKFADVEKLEDEIKKLDEVIRRLCGTEIPTKMRRFCPCCRDLSRRVLFNSFALQNGKAVVCGSRAHLEKDSIAQVGV